MNERVYALVTFLNDPMDRAAIELTEDEFNAIRARK